MIRLRAAPAPPFRRRSSRELRQTAHGKLVVIASVAVLAGMVGAFTDVPRSWVVVTGAVMAVAIAAVLRVSSLAMPVIAYAGVWLGFNLLRARADGTLWADETLGRIAQLEAQLFDSALPSTVLFGLALVGFYTVPTAPPWLVTEVVPEGSFVQILRVVPIVAAHLDLPVELYHRGLHGSVVVSEVKIEPNPMAAMPSIHFAVTALLVFPAWRLHRGLVPGALGYTLLMGAALVFLGEHYLLDLVAGGLFAAISWFGAARILDPTQNGPNL